MFSQDEEMYAVLENIGVRRLNEASPNYKVWNIVSNVHDPLAASPNS